MNREAWVWRSRMGEVRIGRKLSESLRKRSVFLVMLMASAAIGTPS